MSEILRGTVEALRLLITGDHDIWGVIFLSLYVSGVALVFSVLLGVPLGALLALRSFPGRRLLIALIYTGLGMPPVVVGLVVYLLLSRSGPLGGWGWLFTPRAMILAQTVISLPVIAGLTMSAMGGVEPQFLLQIRSLGATSAQLAGAVLWEARHGVVVAIVAGFGSIISEVGAVMLVGGNIEGSTRVLTTAIVLETRQGAFDVALALALVLLAITFTLNALTLRLQGHLVR